MNWVRRHPVATFLSVTYALTILIFAFPLLANTGLGVIDVDLPGAAPFVLVGALALAGVAFIVTALADGRAGVREFRRRAFRFRVSPVWYAVAVLILPLAALAVGAVGQGLEPFMAFGRSPTLLLEWLIALLVAAVLVNFWEEVGWTGFVLHRIQPRIGPLLSSVVTTWGQATMHLPLVFIAGGVTDARVTPDQYPFYLAALYVLPIPVRVVLTWLYNRSGSSVPITGLYHAAFGIASGGTFLPVLAPAVPSVWVYGGFAAVALVVAVATRGRLGYEPSEDGRRAASAAALTPATGSTR